MARVGWTTPSYSSSWSRRRYSGDLAVVEHRVVVVRRHGGSIDRSGSSAACTHRIVPLLRRNLVVPSVGREFARSPRAESNRADAFRKRELAWFTCSIKTPHSQRSGNPTPSSPARTERASTTLIAGASTSTRTTFCRASTDRYNPTSSRRVSCTLPDSNRARGGLKNRPPRQGEEGAWRPVRGSNSSRRLEKPTAAPAAHGPLSRPRDSNSSAPLTGRRSPQERPANCCDGRTRTCSWISPTG